MSEESVKHPTIVGVIAIMMPMLAFGFLITTGVRHDNERRAMARQDQQQLIANTAQQYPWIKLSQVENIAGYWADADVVVKISKSCVYHMTAMTSPKQKWHLVPHSQYSNVDSYKIRNGQPPYGLASCPKDPLKPPN